MAVKQYEPDLEVIVVEPEVEPLEPHVFEFPLLDGEELAEYQHAPATAGLDYPAPGAEEGVLVDEPEATPKKSAKKAE